MLNTFIQAIISRTFTTQSVKITAFNYFKQVVCEISKTAVKRVIKTVSVTYFACNELRYRNIICYMFQLLGYLMSIVSSVWSLKSNPTVAQQSLSDCFVSVDLTKIDVAEIIKKISESDNPFTLTAINTSSNKNIVDTQIVSDEEFERSFYSKDME